MRLYRPVQQFAINNNYFTGLSKHIFLIYVCPIVLFLYVGLPNNMFYVCRMPDHVLIWTALSSCPSSPPYCPRPLVFLDQQEGDSLVRLYRSAQQFADLFTCLSNHMFYLCSSAQSHCLCLFVGVSSEIVSIRRSAQSYCFYVQVCPIDCFCVQGCPII